MSFILFVVSFVLLVGCIVFILKTEEEIWEFFGYLFTFVTAVCLVVWGAMYLERWDNQREVEAFCKSNIQQKYLEVISGPKLDGQILNLEPVGANIKDWNYQVRWVNQIIQEHNAANAVWYLDFSYPDWDAPPQIVF